MIQGTLHGTITSHWPWNAGIWPIVFEWLLQLDAKANIGRYELQSSKLFATIMEYDTIPRDAATFESHQDFVDVHYTLNGQEEIDWLPVAVLTSAGLLHEDTLLWVNPTYGWSSLSQSSGRFAVFFTDDAHRPKVNSGSASVKKVVVKIHRTLLGF